MILNRGKKYRTCSRSVYLRPHGTFTPTPQKTITYSNRKKERSKDRDKQEKTSGWHNVTPVFDGFAVSCGCTTSINTHEIRTLLDFARATREAFYTHHFLFICQHISCHDPHGICVQRVTTSYVYSGTKVIGLLGCLPPF